MGLFQCIYSMVLAEKTALTWLLTLKTAKSRLSHAQSKDCSNHLKGQNPARFFYLKGTFEQDFFISNFFKNTLIPSFSINNTNLNLNSRNNSGFCIRFFFWRSDEASSIAYSAESMFLASFLNESRLFDDFPYYL
jgi:hypothetical protein